MRYTGTIKQGGTTVVSIDGDLEQVWAELGHYLYLYMQDGPIDSVIVEKLKWEYQFTKQMFGPHTN